MENFYIPGSEYIPEVNLNAETGILSFSGESYHEYTLEFFEPMLRLMHFLALAPSLGNTYRITPTLGLQ
ncbi:MAG: DUF1987 domain-containing protein, partial [Bacteroidetes bacterium]